MKSRRTFLRSAFSIAVGAGVLLISDGFTKAPLAQIAGNLGSSSVSTNGSTESRASLVTVTVYYSMIAQYTSANDEYFVLQGPATLQDLMDTVLVRHPSMRQMMQMMLILLNGVPAKPSASLKDGDRVQFIPLSAGG
ncbi:MAG: MoaD/ThiS family protein [Candidatus Bathyarchaeia archaeon]|jgi:molybdopterin converting factor small subunit